MTHHSKQEVNWDFLLASSKSTLQAYEMSRLNLAANVRKEIVQLLDAWVNENSNALLARWLIERDLAADAGEISADPIHDLQSSAPPSTGGIAGTGGPLPCAPQNTPKPSSVPMDLGVTGSRLPHGPQNAPKPSSRAAQSAGSPAHSASDKIFGDNPFVPSRIHASS